MFASRVPRFSQPRLEVYSIKFIKKKNSNNNNNATDDDDEFKGMIYINDGGCFHEFYNSEKAKEYNLLYTELPKRKKLELRVTNDDDEEEVPVMGPHSAFMMCDFFLVVVHNDTSNPTTYELDEGVYPTLFDGDDCDNWKPVVFGDLPKCAENVPMFIEVDGPLRSLKLECLIFRDSKVVRVQAKWIPHQKSASDSNTDDDNSTDDDDDIYILGKISLSSLGTSGYQSILFETPPNKALKASVTHPIPLLKSVVTVPYHSDFIVAADLQAAPSIDDVVNDDDSSAVAIVNGIARFSQPQYEDCPHEFFDGFNLQAFNVQAVDEADFQAKIRKYNGSIFHKSVKHITGNGADIEVTVIVDVR